MQSEEGVDALASEGLDDSFKMQVIDFVFYLFVEWLRQEEEGDFQGQVNEHYEIALEEDESIEDKCEEEKHQPFAVLRREPLRTSLQRCVGEQRVGDDDV